MRFVLLILNLLTLNLLAQDDYFTVYVCKKFDAKTYHNSNTCEVLNGCQQGLHTSSDSAIMVMKRRPCCKCIGGEGCITDPHTNNATTSGFDGDWTDGCADGCGDGLSGCNDPVAGAVVGGVALAGLVVLLSNDIYIGATYSFFSDLQLPKPKMEGIHINKVVAEPGFGFDFHLRKNWEVCNLQYGGSYISFTEVISGSYDSTGNPYTGHKIVERFSAFAALPFYLNGKYSEKRFNVFAGPAFRWYFDAGVGGVLGFHYRMGEFFKFDLRYELTNLSSQFQAGIVLTYQREYRWNK